MKKIFLALLIAVCTVGAAGAQRRTVSGVVADADTRQSLIGVVVQFAPVTDSTAVTAMVSGTGGVFSTGLAQGQYNMQAAMLGYEPAKQQIEVAGERVRLDTVFIRQGIQIDAVVKEAVAIRTTLEGDTVIYNADSYKVTADADVSTLLQKMPGIKVEGGTVEAQGEVIQKVLVDGKEFFGNDVAAAIATLPAEAVKNIELFNKLSDNAEFTGIDDGNSYKAINIITREAMRSMITGKVNALYGVEPPKHSEDGWHNFGLVGANINILRGDSRLTFGGVLNNIDERSFTFNDPLGVGDDDVAKVGRFQFNYNDMLGKKNQWTVQASYSYNVTDSESDSSVDRTYYESDDPARPVPYSRYYSESYRSSLNQGHSFSTRIDFKPNEFHQLRIRSSVGFQGNRSNGNGFGIYTPADGSDDLLLDNWNKSTGNSLSTNLNVNYSVRLGKPGRTLNFFLSGNYGPTDRDNESYSERPDRPTRWQALPSHNAGYGMSGAIAYTEPIGEFSLISLNYDLNYGYSDEDRKSYPWDPELNDGEGGFNWSTPVAELSGLLTRNNITHRVGPRYSITKNETTFSAGVAYQYSVNEVDRVLPVPLAMEADFHNVTYDLMLRSKLSQSTSLRISLRSNTRNPDVSNLQDVPDISNSQNIRRGNPDLKPSYTNSFNANYNISQTEEGRTLSFYVGGSHTINTIATRTLINSEGYLIHNPEGAVVDTLDAVGRYSRPINLNGQWSARVGAGFGVPIKFLKSNLNINADLSYSRTPSQTGTWNPSMTEPVYTTNYSNRISPGGRISLGSNISENVDFQVDYGIGYENVKNTFSERSDNRSLDQWVRARFKFILPLGFTIAGNMNYNNNRSLTRDDDNDEYFIANMSIGKKVFRSQRGEVSLFVNNLLNQNDSFRRNYNDDYYQSQIRSTIGRYFGVSFTWNIRKFSGGSGNTPPDESVIGTGGQRPAGPGGNGAQGGGAPRGGAPAGGLGGGYGGRGR